MAFICEDCDWVGDIPAPADKVCPNCDKPLVPEEGDEIECRVEWVYSDTLKPFGGESFTLKVV